MKNEVDLRIATKFSLRVFFLVSAFALVSAPNALARWGGGGGGGGFGGRGGYGVLGGQAERVPSHGMQHVESRHPLVAADHVAWDVVVQMADAEAGAGGVGEHLEDVELGAPGILARQVEVGAFPIGLPRGFDFLGVVAFVHSDESQPDGV